MQSVQIRVGFLLFINVPFVSYVASVVAIIKKKPLGGAWVMLAKQTNSDVAWERKENRKENRKGNKNPIGVSI